MLIWSNYYNIVLPLTLPPLYFGFCLWNHVQDICTKITHNLHNKLSFIHVYSTIVYFVAIPYDSINYCFFITWIFSVCRICYSCYCCYIFVMVYVWPLSPSSCEVATIAITITKWVVRDISIAITLSSNFVWTNTCCAFCYVETSTKTCSSIGVIVYSSTTSFVVSPPHKSIGELDWTS